MAPHTRSSTKHTPGRATRNSVYGRPSPSPAKTARKTKTTDSAPSQVAPLRKIETEDKATLDVGDNKGTPWLACRDGDGVTTTIAVSDTGEGVHIRWYYPDDEDEEADAAMIVDEERGDTPPITAAGASNPVRRLFPQTPMALQPYDAGSVIRTPVKRARPLQRSPPRIGDKGIRCLYEMGGILRELNGRVRFVLRHPVGSITNLSREQVERLEDERVDKIVQVQVERLLEADRRLREKEAEECFSGCEDEMDTDSPSRSTLGRNFGSEGSVSHDELPKVAPPVPLEQIRVAQEGPSTLGVNSTSGSPRKIRREQAFRLPTNSVGVRLGPEGTLLID